MNNPPYPSPNPAAGSPQPNAPKAPKAPKALKRLSPDESRRRARIFKRVALAGTTLAFCGLSGLAASHLVGVTSAAGSAAPTAAPTQHDDHGGFFPSNSDHSDDGENHDGQSGGFNFGSGGNFQPPSSTSGGS